MANISQITHAALSLPLSDRIQLAQQLWASLDFSAAENAENPEREVLDLADQRDTDLENGSVESVSHADALTIARKSLECE